jgi:hypothetical protein
MYNLKQKIVLLIIVQTCVLSTLSAQSGNSDFREYVKKQREEFELHRQQIRKDFQNYRDSINREYASFLEQRWKVFNLQKEEPPIKTPIAVPPVYDAVAPKPQPVKIPVSEQLQPPRTSPPKQDVTAPEEKPVRTPVPPKHSQPPEEKTSPPSPVTSQYPVKTEFYGTQVALKSVTASSFRRLAGVSEKDVASYWNSLSQHPHAEWSNEISRLTSELNLNDWGMYLLINKLFAVWFPQGTANEQVVFSIFMLNQSGYRAKIGRNNNDLVPLIASQNKIHHTVFFRYGDVRYSAFNPQHKDLSSIRACEIDYPGATRSMDMSITTVPRLSVSLNEKTLKGAQSSGGKIVYNKNLVDFYSTYPCVEFSVYAEAPFDRASLQSVESQTGQNIRSMSQEDGVNILLHFVQQAFEYKTDTQQYGYERWMFAEETLASTYSDCDDRAILFAQLIRQILGMKVVLIYYTGVHLATAVHFDNPQTGGDYVMVDNEKYLICDPTYRGANFGVAMPKLKNEKVEVIKLRF